MYSSSVEGAWIAVQVRINRELAVADQLELRGYESFAPIHAMKLPAKAPRLRKALFPGYIFCRYKTLHPFKIVETPWVIRIVSTGGVPHPISDEEIDAVRRVVSAGFPVDSWNAVPAGADVCITSGPLTGVVGRFVEVRNCSKLLISVTAIQRHIVVEVGMDDVTAKKCA